jgi:hypothetical protein
MQQFGVVIFFHSLKSYYNHLSFFFAEAPRLSRSGMRDALPRWCKKSLFIHFSHISLISSNRTVKGIKFSVPNIPSFSLSDLERMKNTNKWLSDAHVTFCLMFVLYFWSVSILMKHRDSFRDCAQRNIWGNLKIQLLDTAFWAQLSEDAEMFVERYRARVNLLEYDFVLMPIFEE